MPFLEAGRPAFGGGGTVFFAELLPRLAALGHRLHVLAEAPPAADGHARTGLPWHVPNLTVEGFAFTHYSSSRPPDPAERARAREALRPAFTRALGAGRPDVVLIGREIAMLTVLDLCRAAPVPSVVVAHGLATAALRSGSYPDALRAELVERFGQADAIVTVARHLERDLRALGLARVTTIANVADASAFRPTPKDSALLAALGLAPDQIVVGHVSVLRPRKRPLDIIASAAAVLRAAPDLAYVVVGDGPCRAEMEAQARRLGIAARFRFTGLVAHAHVARYLNLADVVLVPSDTEGFPLVYCEAQACGRALLASDIPPAREAIVDGKTGLLFRTGDVADLTAKTLRLTGDPELRERLGRQARAGAEARSVTDWARAYGQVLATAAARPSARPHPV